MPGVTVEDEVGRLMMRGYHLVSRGDNEALLAQPRTRSGGESALLIIGILLGAVGIVIGATGSQVWIFGVGVAVLAMTLLLYAVKRRPAGIRVFLDTTGEVRHERVRGSHW